MVAKPDAQLPPDDPKTVRRLPHREMLRGPIPIAWLQSAARLPGRSLHAGLALWIAATQSRTRIVPLSNLDGVRLGCGRNQKYRALAWLEAAGLVTVQRQLGRAPIVTILTRPSSPSADAEAVKRSETAKVSADGGQQKLRRGGGRTGARCDTTQ